MRFHLQACATETRPWRQRIGDAGGWGGGGGQAPKAEGSSGMMDTLEPDAMTMQASVLGAANGDSRVVFPAQDGLNYYGVTTPQALGGVLGQ